MIYNQLTGVNHHYLNFTEDDNISESALSLEALESLNSSNDGLITTYYVIRHFLTPAVCLFSMVALCITLLFLCRRKSGRAAVQIYFKCMGLVDLLGLLVLFISSLDYFMLSSHVHAYYASAFVRCLHGTLLGLLLASNWLMTAQAIEKTIAISRPFKAKQIRSKHRRCVVSLICGLSAILTVPTLAMDVAELTRYENITPDSTVFVHVGIPSSVVSNSEKQTQPWTADAISSSAHRPTTLFNNSKEWRQSLQNLSHFSQAVYLRDRWPASLKMFQCVQAWLVHFIIFFVLPFCFLCLASFRLLYAVRMSSRFVQQHCIRGGAEFKSTVREEARMTVLVLCLIGAFFTCQSPFVVYSACRKVGILSTPSHGHSLLRAFIILALALKTDCTFVFHCWLNHRFALAIRRMLCSFSASKRSTARYHGFSKDNSAMSNRPHEERQLMNLDSSKGENRIRNLLREIKSPATFEMKERGISTSSFKEGVCQCAARIPNGENNIMGEQLHLQIFTPHENRDLIGHNKQPNSREGQQARHGSNCIQERYSDLAMNTVNSQKLHSDKELYEQTKDHPNTTTPPEKKKRHNRSQLQADLIGPRWYSENDLCTSCATTDCSCNSSCNLHLSPGHSTACSSPYCESAPISQLSSQIHVRPTTIFINDTTKHASVEKMILSKC